MYPFTLLHKNRLGRLCGFLHFRVGWFFLWHISGKRWPFSSFMDSVYAVCMYKYTLCIQCVWAPVKWKKHLPKHTNVLQLPLAHGCIWHSCHLLPFHCCAISSSPGCAVSVFCVLGVLWNMCDLTANIHALFLIMMHLNLNGTSLCWRHSSSVALLVSSLCLFHRYTDQQSFSSHFEFLATERLCI